MANGAYRTFLQTSLLSVEVCGSYVHRRLFCTGWARHCALHRPWVQHLRHSTVDLCRDAALAACGVNLAADLQTIVPGQKRRVHWHIEQELDSGSQTNVHQPTSINRWQRQWTHTSPDLYAMVNPGSRLKGPFSWIRSDGVGLAQKQR